MFPYNNQGYFPYPQTFSYEQPETIYYQGRAFVRSHSAMPSSMWIEKGSDGRGYYVKKKPAVPSLRKKFAEAFHDFRQRSHQPKTSSPQQTSTTSTSNGSATQETTSRRPSKPQADMTNHNKEVAKSGQTLQPYSFAPHMPYYGLPQVPGHNPYQYWQSPGAYNPALMPNPYAPYQRQFPGMSGPFPQPPVQPAIKAATTQPPSDTQAQTPAVSAPQTNMTVATQTTANNLAMSQMAVNPDGLKFKCMICGRFRSTHYHLKHRLAPGQLPGPTICRKCRKHTTESEDETSDSEEDDLLYRSRSVVRNRSRSRAASRARSSGRMTKRRHDFDYYALHSVEDSSSDSEDLPPRSSRARSRRARNVRYEDEAYPVKRAKSKTRKVIYMQEPSLQSEASDDEVEVRYIKQAPENSVVRNRPGTPGPPGLGKHLSHEISKPVYVEQRVYYDEPPASLSGKAIPPAEFNTNNPYRSVPVSQFEHHLPFPGYGPQQHVPIQPVSAGVPSGHPPAASEDQGRFGYKNGPSVPYAPTPPEMYRKRSRGPSRGAERCAGSFEKVNGDRVRSRSRSRGRRRSMDQSLSDDQSPPADDYDWYDADGMKVCKY